MPLALVRSKGFTLVELIVVMGILAVLFAIMTIGFFDVQGRSKLAEGVGILVADLQSQQNKAMTGAALAGAGQSAYGVYWETNTYTLFGGTTYDVNDPNNRVVALPAGVSVGGISWTDNLVVFAGGSGEVVGYAGGADSVTLTASGGESETVRLNGLGVIVEGI